MTAHYTRRNFLGGLAKRFMSEIAQSAHASLDPLNRELGPEKEVSPVSWIRPPGALGEDEFLATCERCSKCVEACEYDSIKRLGFELGPCEGTPAIIPDETPCYLCKDLPCVAACPSGALSLVDRAKARMAQAEIDYKKCYAVAGQPCDYCTARCPLGEQVIVMDDASHPRIKQPACTGCGVCAYLCPANAISLLGCEERDEAMPDAGGSAQDMSGDGFLGLPGGFGRSGVERSSRFSQKNPF